MPFVRDLSREKLSRYPRKTVSKGMGAARGNEGYERVAEGRELRAGCPRKTFRSTRGTKGTGAVRGKGSHGRASDEGRATTGGPVMGKGGGF